MRIPRRLGAYASRGPSAVVVVPSASFSKAIGDDLVVSGTCANATEVSTYYRVDGGSWILIDTDSTNPPLTGTYATSHTLTTGDDGAVDVQAVATDGVLYGYSAIVSGTVAAALPTVAISAPADGTVKDVAIDGTLGVDVTLDADSCVVEGSTDYGSTWTEWGTLTASGTVTRTLVSGDAGTVTIRATATRGVQTATDYAVVTVTNTVTAINALSPAIFLLTGRRGAGDLTEDANGISQWTDLSGNGVHCTQSTNADKPVSATASGDTYVSFTAGADTNGKRLTPASNTWISGGSAATIHIACSVTADGTAYVLWSSDTTDFRVMITTSNTIRFTIGTAYADFAITTGDHVISVRFDGSASYNSGRVWCYLDGVKQTLTYSGTFPATIPAITATAIGRNSNDVSPLVGRIYSIVGFSSAQSKTGMATVWQQLRGALAWQASGYAFATPLASLSLPTGLVLAQGDIQTHSSYSNDATGDPPSGMYATAEAGGMSMCATTDHRVWVTDGEWSATATQAAAACSTTFVALRGIEYEAGTEHCLVFGSSNMYSDPADAAALFTSIEGDADDAIGCFAHPAETGYVWTDTAYVSAADERMALCEFTDASGVQYFSARLAKYQEFLTAGWHVAPCWNSDTHAESPGTGGVDGVRTTVFAASLATADVLAGMRARRTNGSDCGTGAWGWMLTAAGAKSGDTVSGVTSADVTVFLEGYDTGWHLIEVYGSTGKLATLQCLGARKAEYTATIDVSSQDYLYAVGKRNDGGRLVIAPIWFE